MGSNTTTLLATRVDSDDRERIEAAAFFMGQTPSAFIRSTALEAADAIFEEHPDEVRSSWEIKRRADQAKAANRARQEARATQA